MNEQIKINAEKINSFFNFPGYFLSLLFIAMLMKINSIFWRWYLRNFCCNLHLIILIIKNLRNWRFLVIRSYLFTFCTLSLSKLTSHMYIKSTPETFEFDLLSSWNMGHFHYIRGLDTIDNSCKYIAISFVY